MTQTIPPLKIVSHELVYQNFVRVDKYQVQRVTYDGSATQTFERHLMSTAGNSVCGLLYDPVAEAFVMVEQFRLVYHLYGGQGDQIEVVAGIVAEGEDLEATFRREAFEEAGCTVRRAVVMLKAFSSPGAFTEESTLYVGEVTAPDHGTLQGLAAEHEDIRVHVIPEAKAIEMLEAGVFKDYKTITALYWFLQHRTRLHAEWLTD